MFAIIINIIILLLTDLFILFSAKGFVQCKLSDPALNECIRDGLQRAVPYMTKGKNNI